MNCQKNLQLSLNCDLVQTLCLRYLVYFSLNIYSISIDFLIVSSFLFVCFQMSQIKTLQHERYLFRQVKQKSGESIDSFCERLRHDIKKCGFKEEEEETRLKEQIIDKCTSVKLREIALQVDMSLEQLIFTGKTVESNDKNKNKITEPSRPYIVRSYSHRDDSRKECSRCGFYDHFYTSPNCPAFKGRCKLCQKQGHFEKMCWNSKLTRHRSRSRSIGDNRNRSYYYDSDSETKPFLSSRDPRSSSTRYERMSSTDQPVKHFQIKIEPKSPEHNSKSPEEYSKSPNERSKSQETVVNSPQDHFKFDELSIKKSEEKNFENIYDCLIGGMASKVVVKSHYPTNVMSKEQFKKLYSGKYKFFTTDFVPSKVGDFTFSGQFTSKIEINNQTQYISFYVQDGSEEVVTIGKKMAEQLGLKII